jgi:GT2 family glycosyltransferase
MTTVHEVVGAVVIGRNEGERLVNCLHSLRAHGLPVVYVDSNSTDDSVRRAREMGVEVVELNLSIPFTAARARNSGAARLRALATPPRYIQFVDGDCEVAPAWLERATRLLDEHTHITATCGRRRERYPQHSFYNAMCDAEWNTPVGPAKAFGGDVLIRAEAFFAVGGFRDDLIAGEEPELCVRLRARGAHIVRIDEEMTLHDAALHRFSQWWRRAERCGHAYAEGAVLHGRAPERHWVAETRRAVIWGIVLPLSCLAAGAVAEPYGWLLAAVYPAQILRIALRLPGPAMLRLQMAALLTTAKFAESKGILRYLINRLRNQKTCLIEYK